MSQVAPHEPLDTQTVLRLTDFARACKAAARAVSLYPPAHPAVGASLDRLVESAGRAVRSGPMTIAVLPDTLLVGDRAPERPDAAITELAALLHDHLIGELELLSAADGAAWQTFLALLARPSIEVQAEGGIARLWAGGGGGEHVRVREVDYAEVLRQRSAGLAARWDTIIRHCLQDDRVELDEQSLAALLEIAEDAERLGEIVDRIEREAADAGVRVQAQALARLLRFIIEAVAARRPEQLDRAFETMAAVAGRLSPEVMLGMLAQRGQADAAGHDVVGEIVARMNDDHVSGFVAQSLVERRGATERLAEAFQALVPEENRRRTVLGLTQQKVENALGPEEDFSRLWKQATDLLLSYKDEPFVNEAYARELSRARAQAVEVDRISDDPPEVVSEWLATISDASVRRLDLQLLLDLLKVAESAEQWQTVARTIVAHVDDLLLLGDFDPAEPLVAALADEAGPRGRPRHQAAAARALDDLRQRHLLKYLPGHLRTIDDEGFENVRKICLSLGTALVRPLAEALAAEERGRAFRRLTDLLVAFGPAGREAVEQLKGSSNPSARRTAIYLLREFGGNEALPELASLLGDSDTNIQRETIRAIALIGTEDAYAVLQEALTSGSLTQRENIVNALGSMRDERAVPLFCHMVRSSEYRRTMRRAYLTAVEGLGAVGGPEAVQALSEALHRGEWWAPFRTAALRRAAAAALRRAGTGDALAVLREAAEQGSRGVRAAAREQLALGGAPAREEAGRA